MKIKTVPLNPWTFFHKFSEGRTILIEEEQDKNSAMLAEIDTVDMEFLTSATEETSEKRLYRLRKTGRMLYGATVFMGFWEDYKARKQESVLESLYREQQIDSIDFFGDVFLAPGDALFSLWLFRVAFSQRWQWGYGWFYARCIEGRASAISLKKL